MIARNAVILIDQIEAVRAEGKPIWDAVIEAAMSRFRPIMLTAISTVLGMIPIAPTIFWGPMAYAIMGGLPGRHGAHARSSCPRSMSTWYVSPGRPPSRVRAAWRLPAPADPADPIVAQDATARSGLR